MLPWDIEPFTEQEADELTQHVGFTGRRLLTPWAFDIGDFACLELGTKIDNVGSQRAALSGFEPEGIWRARLRHADGTFSDGSALLSGQPAL